MRHIHTEPLSSMARAVLNRNSRPISGFRHVGLNPEQMMELQLIAERRAQR
jgi:hypothetical protein